LQVQKESCKFNLLHIQFETLMIIAMEILTTDVLNQLFEPNLVEEMLQFPSFSVKGGESMGKSDCSAGVIPILISGNLKLFKTDEHGRESVIYNILPGQSCILSITSGFTGQNILADACAVEDSLMYAIPAEVSNAWLGKYASWRAFVIGLYDSRLHELVVQHQAVTRQRDDIEKKNLHITESIRYARRIQQAILPPDKLLNELVPNHFVYYKPKDIVSGDFYWVNQSENKVYLAAADATGHGVPGAFMSLLGVSLLNEIARSAAPKTAADFLNELRIKLKEALRQSEYEATTRDGVDLAFCVIDKQTGELQFAGAYNPLIIVRKGEMIEIKADKMPIGIHYNEKEFFTNHLVQLQANDAIYIYSDGFADQIGGPTDRKFLSKNFKKLLVEIAELPIEQQKEKLRTTLKEWQGNSDQVDDILVIGVQFTIKTNVN